MEEPKIDEFCYRRIEEIDNASIAIARISNDFGTVLRYSVSIGKGERHIQLSMSENEFVDFVDNIYNKIYGNECVFCEEKSSEKVTVCNSCWEYKMNFGV